ncbi:conjugal transfer protein TraM [Nitrosomonas halophila]|uniref:Transcriptional activator TraM n=1 Tax=Nitrosomonas halophila TaxID=44576 RepID=A0A1H3N0A5_9PROT|nr:conjugal transfer protein TraM [Nitrosomonas halophila]SDY81669.1 Transcriptional activator TraM [Nitrosomonas halophila]
MEDKIEETIKVIAVRHGIAVSRDDPIMVLQTINDRLMQDSQAAQQEMLEGFKSELEAIAHRWGDDSKRKAERTLNAALAASKEAIAQGMKEGAKAAAESVQREFDASVTKLADSILDARRVSMLNMVAAFLVVLAAALVLWASI